jgi:hypothetical protein
LEFYEYKKIEKRPIHEQGRTTSSFPFPLACSQTNVSHVVFMEAYYKVTIAYHMGYGTFKQEIHQAVDHFKLPCKEKENSIGLKL